MCKPPLISDNGYACNKECPLVMEANLDNFCVLSSNDFKLNGETIPWLSSGYNIKPRSISSEGHGYYNGRSTAIGVEHVYLPYEFL